MAQMEKTFPGSDAVSLSGCTSAFVQLNFALPVGCYASTLTQQLCGWSPGRSETREKRQNSEELRQFEGFFGGLKVKFDMKHRRQFCCCFGKFGVTFLFLRQLRHLKVP